MNTSNLINWIFSICAYSINCASLIKGNIPVHDTGGFKRDNNLIQGKFIRRQRQREKDYVLNSINFFPLKYCYMIQIFHSPITTFSERLFSNIIKNRQNNLIRYGAVGGGLLISCRLLYDNKRLMNRLLPNEFIRMGSTLITTSSICIDYRLQEIIEGDLNICHKRASIKIGNLCASNGGLYIKAAQYLSSMDHLLPKCYIEELSKLQDQAPASSMEDIEQVFKEEFGGKELNELFYDICHVPIGSASVGQVHLAKLRSTGEEVALKIQHPNIKKDSEIDLKSFKLVLKIVKQFYPTLNFDWIVDEFRSCLESELNFKIEAENSKKTKIAFENDSKFRRMVLIPKVYDNLTSERVLTMEFITGFKINDIEGMKSAGLDLKMINHLMYEVFMKMIFKHNFLHCDPHPGNILINTPVNGGDIRIVILDHGIYKIIPSNVVTKFSRLFLAILEKDFKTISELSKDFDISVEILEEIVSLLKKDFKSLDTDDLREEIGNFIMKQSESNKIQASEALKTIPREFYFIIKVIDVLRSNERCLTCETKTRNIPSSLFILANYCLNHQDPKSISNLIVNYFKLLKWFIFRNRT